MYMYKNGKWNRVKSNKKLEKSIYGISLNKMALRNDESFKLNNFYIEIAYCNVL